MVYINTFVGHSRLSTQDLLQAVNEALAAGETEFHIAAAGQHDIGGPLWHPQGKSLRFYITNPGQRVGAMCLAGTEITVVGSAPADVGWLNAGGHIVVQGDAGDTAGHCAAAGTIYIGGRAGVRSGSLMKHDPLYAPPELWILKSCGSFSFEFMSGGIAVVCGLDCPPGTSVLGERSCVGMVGGTLYYRGHATGISNRDVEVQPLAAEDIAFLERGLAHFLAAVGQSERRAELSAWHQWRKAVPLSRAVRAQQTVADLARFRQERWVKGGLFADVCQDDGLAVDLTPTGLYRQRVPCWQSPDGQCRDCRQCLQCCPQHAISRREGATSVQYIAIEARCIGCGLCAAACPQGVWQLLENPTPIPMYAPARRDTDATVYNRKEHKCASYG